MSSTSVLRTNARRRALSLVELLIVLVVLVVLGGLLIPVFTGVKERAESAATMATMRQIQQAILGDGQNPGYFADMGRLPRPCAGLAGQFLCEGEPGRGNRPNHPQLRYLYINPYNETVSSYLDIGEDFHWSPATGRGWRGPYMQSATGHYRIDETRRFFSRYGGENNPFPNTFPAGADPAPLDAWGNPIVIQEPQEDELAQQVPEFLRLGTRLVSAGPNGIIDTPPGIWNPLLEERGDDIVLFIFGPDPSE